MSLLKIKRKIGILTNEDKKSHGVEMMSLKPDTGSEPIYM